MTPKQDSDAEKRRLANEYGRANRDYFDSDGVPVEEVFEAGFDAGRASMREEVLKILRSEDAQIWQNSDTYGDMECVADWLEDQLNGK